MITNNILNKTANTAFHVILLIYTNQPNYYTDLQEIENNTWVRGNTRFISSVERDISRVSAAN